VQEQLDGVTHAVLCPFFVGGTGTACHPLRWADLEHLLREKRGNGTVVEGAAAKEGRSRLAWTLGGAHLLGDSERLRARVAGSKCALCVRPPLALCLE
jgi:hypothetical protein